MRYFLLHYHSPYLGEDEIEAWAYDGDIFEYDDGDFVPQMKEEYAEGLWRQWHHEDPRWESFEEWCDVCYVEVEEIPEQDPNFDWNIIYF